MNYLKTNVDISHLSNFKTKAKTKYYYEINEYNDIFKLNDIWNFSRQNNLWFLIIWGWTNVLFAFSEYSWVIIKNNLKWLEYDNTSKLLKVYTSESIWTVAEALEKDYNNDLWHRFIGLPGSIWWAVFWNAWCFWLETESNFVSCEVYDLSSWEIKIFSKNDMSFTYRDSFFKQNEGYFIINATFDLSKKIEKYSSDVDNIKFREEVQPAWNSCWSFFKNPSKEHSAWFLIENVWLKWYFHKNAFFSEKHANFLMMNVDNGDYNDLLELMKIAQDKVFLKFWETLENEVRIIKN